MNIVEMKLLILQIPYVSFGKLKAVMLWRSPFCPNEDKRPHATQGFHALSPLWVFSLLRLLWRPWFCILPLSISGHSYLILFFHKHDGFQPSLSLYSFKEVIFTCGLFQAHYMLIYVSCGFVRVQESQKEEPRLNVQRQWALILQKLPTCRSHHLWKCRPPEGLIGPLLCRAGRIFLQGLNNL